MVTTPPWPKVHIPSRSPSQSLPPNVLTIFERELKILYFLFNKHDSNSILRRLLYDDCSLSSDTN